VSADAFAPTIVGFFCNWCSYTAADLAGVSRRHYEPTLRIIRVMCSSRIDPHMVVTAFLGGADAVLIAGCHPGDCHYVTGNYRTRRRVALLKSMFETLGLETERLKLAWIGASEGGIVAEVVNGLTRAIEQIGPNPTREAMFL
jgi:F420-non-reducing hydrogenase iron-sulfur subunit